MHSYQAWFEVDVASGLNAHLRYLADVLEEGCCLYIRYLDKSVEMPVHKRCFKSKPNVLSPLIRTSDVGRSELAKIREVLESEGFSLRLRRSPEKKFLNQVTVPLPTDNPAYPLNVRSVLGIVAGVIGEEMPDRVVVGYDQIRFSERLPGQIHFNSNAAKLGYELGKRMGSLLNDG